MKRRWLEFAILAWDDLLPALLEVPSAAYLAWSRRAPSVPAPIAPAPAASGKPSR